MHQSSGLGAQWIKNPQSRLFAQLHKDYSKSMKKLNHQQLTSLNPLLRLVFSTVAQGMGVFAPTCSVVPIFLMADPTIDGKIALRN